MKKTTETPVFLRGRKTILRPLSESDLPLCQKWINDPEVRKFIKNIFPMTMGAEREWLESRSKKNDKDIILVIEVKGRPIGTMGIHGIDWRNRTATTGALIGEKEYWGKGYGTDAKMALIGIGTRSFWGSSGATGCRIGRNGGRDKARFGLVRFGSQIAGGSQMWAAFLIAINREAQPDRSLAALTISLKERSYFSLNCLSAVPRLETRRNR
ncbi:MAG: GNAT family N-acetyltransferase [Patescibacteria group bacterium]|nr:GNAT family N-acetyltransferase [Patescibacteria group bacterium]